MSESRSAIANLGGPGTYQLKDNNNDNKIIALYCTPGIVNDIENRFTYTKLQDKQGGLVATERSHAGNFIRKEEWITIT